MLSTVPVSSDEPNPMYPCTKCKHKQTFAMIYSQMGEIDTAFEWLDKAYEDQEVEMYWLKVEPPFEPLRGDPRWQVILYKVGFPH